ncbi:MAG: hypothetical protein K2Q20_06705 [Phycisphaerales bacterium]|nr:hypothetical protein [Phycisphaerales bacterium]
MQSDPPSPAPNHARYASARRRGFLLAGLAFLSAAAFALHTDHLATIHVRGLPGRVSTALFGPPRVYVESTFAYIDMFSNPPAVLVPPGPDQPAAVFFLTFSRSPRGLWSPTWMIGPTFRWSPSETAVYQTTPWPPDAAINAFREHLRLQYTPAAISDLDAAIAAGGVVRRTLWSGYLHNTAALMLGALTVFSALRSAALLRLAARLARSLCPRCRYDLIGLPSTALTCPECGTPFNDAPRLNPQPAERAQEP